MKRFKDLFEAPKDPISRHGIQAQTGQVEIEPDDEEATTYKPRSRKEQEFKDKHTIQKVAHPVAPDSQFTGDKEGDPEHHQGGKKQANGESSPIKQGSSDVQPGGTPFKSFMQYGRGGEKTPVMQGSSKIKEEVEEFDEELTYAQKDAHFKLMNKHRIAAKSAKGADKDRHRMAAADHQHALQNPWYAKSHNDAMAASKKLGVTTEEVELEEGVVDTLKKIVTSKQPMEVKFKNGKSLKVDSKTASALMTVHGALKPENAKKLRDNLEQGPTQFMNMVDFAVSNA